MEQQVKVHCKSILDGTTGKSSLQMYISIIGYQYTPTQRLDFDRIEY